MSESIGGVTPLESVLSGVCANITQDDIHASGQTFIPLLDAVNATMAMDGDMHAWLVQFVEDRREAYL